MEKDNLLERLEVLNTKPTFSRSSCDEYKIIINRLEDLGVLPVSDRLNDTDKNMQLSSLPDYVISEDEIHTLGQLGINTIGELLDLNRLDTNNFRGFGAKRWLSLYRVQQLVYEHIKPNDEQEEIQDLIPFSLQELYDINMKMLNMETLNGKMKPYDTEEYNSLLIQLKARGQHRSDLYYNKELNDVPIDVINNTNRYSKLIKNLGIKRLVQILDVTKKDVSRVPDLGLKTWVEIVNIKNDIICNENNYIERFITFHKLHELPETREDLPLYQKILLAITQLADVVEGRGDKITAIILREYFINGTCKDEIKKILARNNIERHVESVRLIKVKVKESIMSGSENPLIDNAYFSDSFINELNNAANEMLYCTKKDAYQILQAPSDYDISPILNLLGLTFMDRSYLDSPRIVSTDDGINFVASHYKKIYDTMKDMAMPASKDEIISLMSEAEDSYDIALFEVLLDHYSWIEKDTDQKYSFIYSKLKKAETKAARIVYENKRVTTKEIKKIDAEKGGSDACRNITWAKIHELYPWVSRGTRNNELIYDPAQSFALPPLREATELYAKQHVFFKFDDMVNELKSKGYRKYAQGSFRTYVLKCCVPSKKDSNLLCLETEIQNHEPDSWRSRTIQGATNWVINSCIQVLGDKTLNRKELNKLVLQLPEAEYYNISHIWASFMSKYYCDADNINPNKPFILDDKGNIRVNKQCLEDGLIDLETIGFVNKQPDYYMDVLTEITKQLKQAIDQRMELVQLRQICSSLITHPSKYTIFYKIINKLPEEVKKIEIDGKTYLELKSSQIPFEKSYSLPSQDKVDKAIDESIILESEAVETTKPDGVYTRGKIEWDEMSQALKKELLYFSRWWDIQDIPLNQGVDLFVEHLKSTEDNVLREDVSRHIYEFLSQKLDRYDLHDHMKSIVLGAEPIIRSIYMTKHPDVACPHTGGLADCLALVPELKNWVDDIYAHQNEERYGDFRKTYMNFYKVRNRIAHGVSLDLSTPQKYMATYCYIALFVYIYNRFV